MNPHYEDSLREIGAHMASIRSKMNIQPHEEMDAILVGVEALACSLLEIASGAEALVRDGQVQGVALVSASLAGRVLTRFAILPAAVGGLTAALILVSGILWASTQFSRESSMIALRFEAETKQLESAYNHLADANRQITIDNEFELRKIINTVNNEYLKTMMYQASVAPQALRGFLQLEANYPGMIEWMQKYGLSARRIFEVNGNKSCPEPYSNNRGAQDCLFKMPLSDN